MVVGGFRSFHVLVLTRDRMYLDECSFKSGERMSVLIQPRTFLVFGWLTTNNINY